MRLAEGVVDVTLFHIAFSAPSNPMFPLLIAKRKDDLVRSIGDQLSELHG